MKLLAIDPGTTESAYAVYDTARKAVTTFSKVDNEALCAMVSGTEGWEPAPVGHLAVEMIASYGMPVGAEVFQTCVWIGRFIESWGKEFSFVYRRDVKLHLCGQPRAKDSNIRQALIDRFGPVGTKRNPGELYGMSGDCWAALGVAVTWADTRAPSELGARGSVL